MRKWQPFEAMEWKDLFPIVVSMQTCDHVVPPSFLPVVYGVPVELDGEYYRVFRTEYKKKPR